MTKHVQIPNALETFLFEKPQHVKNLSASTLGGENNKMFGVDIPKTSKLQTFHHSRRPRQANTSAPQTHQHTFSGNLNTGPHASKNGEDEASNKKTSTLQAHLYANASLKIL